MTSSEQRRRGYRSVMAVCLVAGLAYLVVGIVTGQIGFGVFGLCLMLAYAGWLTWRRHRSEETAILAGEGVDERQRQITNLAGALVGHVLVVVVLVGLFVSLFTQWDVGVGVFGGLAAVAGVSYGVAVGYYVRRT